MAVQNKIISNPQTGQEIRFLQTSKDTDGQFLEMETTYRAHSNEPVPHYHPFQREDFRVLAGELSVRITGQLKVLQAGDTLHIPANTVHSMWNNSDNQTVVHWKVHPAMNTEHLLETGIGLATDGKTKANGMPNILQIALMANKYAREYRLIKPPFFVQKVIFLLLTPFAYLLGYRPTYSKYLD